MMTKNNKIKLFFKYYFPVLFWMGLIFCLSSIKGNEARLDPDAWFYIKRKGAHVFEYFVFTILIVRAMLASFDKKKDFVKLIAISGFLAFLYAISDEIHQTFVFGREGKALDIAIDLIGILIAILIVIKFRKNKHLRGLRRLKKR